MNQMPLIKSTPWDEVIFGMPTWELLEYYETSLQQAMHAKGHQTIRVDPLADKQLLHQHGFYYCDTLIVPSCKAERLRAVHHPDATISKSFNAGYMLEVFHGIFMH